MNTYSSFRREEGRAPTRSSTYDVVQYLKKHNPEAEVREICDICVFVCVTCALYPSV